MASRVICVLWSVSVCQGVYRVRGESLVNVCVPEGGIILYPVYTQEEGTQLSIVYLTLTYIPIVQLPIHSNMFVFRKKKYGWVVSWFCLISDHEFHVLLAGNKLDGSLV